MKVLQIFLLLCIGLLQRVRSQSVTIDGVITTASPTEAIAPNEIDESLGVVSPVSEETIEPSLRPTPSIAANVNTDNTTSNAVAIPRPTPYPTFSSTYASPTDDFFGSALPSTISVYAVLSLTFPSNTTYNESAVDSIANTVETFLSDKGNFSSVPLTVGIQLEDIYGVAPLVGEGESQLAATIEVTVPWVEMNFVDEYTLQQILAQSIDSSEDDLVKLLSDAFGFDSEKSGVQVSFIVIFTPPTSFPTMAPTTVEFKNAKRRVIVTRSWLLVTLFWVIVICCFSLENGLCACRFGKRREEYAGVEIGSGGFD